MFIKSALSKSPQKFFWYCRPYCCCATKMEEGILGNKFPDTPSSIFVLPKAAMVCNLCNLWCGWPPRALSLFWKATCKCSAKDLKKCRMTADACRKRFHLAQTCFHKVVRETMLKFHVFSERKKPVSFCVVLSYIFNLEQKATKNLPPKAGFLLCVESCKKSDFEICFIFYNRIP